MGKVKVRSQKELKSKQKSTNAKKKDLSSSGTVKSTKRKISERQYSMGTDNSGFNVHYYKFSGKQMKSWKPIGKSLQEYLYHLVDSAVRMVGSKKQFANNEDVQSLLNELRLQLKAKLCTIKVPNKRPVDYNKLKIKTDELKAELESLVQQQQQLLMAIREEERAIEGMEDSEEINDQTSLLFKVPDDQLDLPSIVE